MELQLRKFGIDNANSWQQIRRAYIKYGVVQDAEEYAGSNKIESEILMRYCQEEENWDAVDLLNLLVHEGHFLNQTTCKGVKSSEHISILYFLSP